MNSDDALRALVTAIVAGNAAAVSRMLAGSPELARASFQVGATRTSEEPHFVEEIRRYIYAGDTALHFAAAAYQFEIVRMLIEAGADVGAKNRLGNQPLHAAAAGSPGSRHWNPPAQVSTIAALIHSGADPNTVNKRGVTALHIAVRTRCADAVRVLLEHGADPARKNDNGSTPLLLATLNTGRPGSGSPEAKGQQGEIIRLLEERTSAQRH